MEGGRGAQSPAVLVSPHYGEGLPFQTSISKLEVLRFPSLSSPSVLYSHFFLGPLTPQKLKKFT